MLKSICIKTNNLKILNYLSNELSNVNLEDFSVSRNSFKIYNNIILHYTGSDFSKFNTLISEVLTNSIMLFYENLLIKRFLNLNYFYFNNSETTQIFNIVKETLNEPEYKNKFNAIYDNVYEFNKNNKSMILDGFVNFRIKSFCSLLDSAVEFSVNKFLIDQEYNEFIKLLQSYIESKKHIADVIHLIYNNQNCILLDNNKNILSLDTSFVNAKYLSDISFSSNDYALNTLLNLLPKQLNIHLIDIEDDFIKTLKLIFGKRIFLCRDCNLCKTYKLTSNLLHAEKE